MALPEGGAPRGSSRHVPAALIWTAGLLLAGRIGGAVWLDRHPGAAGGPEAGDAVAWVAPEAAEGLARKTGRPVLYDFTAAWCPPCKRMAAEVFANADDAAFINAHAVPVHVVDRTSEEGKNPPLIAALQKRFGIEAFPTLVIVYADGRQPAKLRGYGSAEGTRSELRAALGGSAVTPPLP